MLSWGRAGGSAGSSKKPVLASRPLPASSGEEAGSDSEAQGALLAGTSALARRRHAVRFKRKSKIAYRVIRSVRVMTRYYLSTMLYYFIRVTTY